MATCPTCRTHYPDDVTTCANDGATLVPDSTFANLDKELAAGEMVGEYRVESKIGEGGFGSVYRAIHPVIGKTAAVKVLNRQFSSNPEMVSRFISEARAVNQIRHKNIIDVFSFGALADGRQYYVMELLEGMTFDRFIKRRGRIPPDEAIPMLRGVARALDAAHAAGIAHRDLKPENVFLVMDDDGTSTAKLLDFGIAKLLGDSSKGHKTQTGVPIGTPYYMSPEQCRGDKVDQRTDIYSFGVMVHETLTGRLPFVADSYMQVMMAHLGSPPPRISEHNPELSPALDAPVQRMLSKDPTQRPDSVSAALEELAQAAKNAGYAVEVMSKSGAQRSGRGGIIAATPGALTPAELEAIGSASTVIQSSGSGTLSAAEKVVPPKSRAMLFGGIAIGAIVVIGAVAFLSRTPRRMPERERERELAGAALGEPPGARPRPQPARPVEAPLAPEKAEIALTIDSDPKDAEVFLGAVKLGTAPGPIHVARGNDRLTLTFKAQGYVQKDVDVMPSADGTIKVELRRRHAGGGKPGGHVSKELEF